MHVPTAKKVPYQHLQWGRHREDPYRWLEDRSDPAVIAHLEAENAYTTTVLEPLAELQHEIFTEIKSRTKETDMSVPVLKDGWAYYARTEAGASYPLHCRQPAESVTLEKLGGDRAAPDDEIIMFDENVEAGDGYFELGVFDVSPDHRLLAWASDTSGAERFTLRFRELRADGTYRDLNDQIDDVAYSSAWSANGDFFFYTTADEANRQDKVWRHRLGSDADEDVVVFEEPDERFNCGVGLDKDEQHIIIASTSLTTDETWVLDATTPSEEFRCLARRRHGIEYSATHHQGRWIILTNDSAENFRLVSAPLTSSDSSGWETIIGERDDTLIAGFDTFTDYLVMVERTEARTQLRIRSWRDAGDDHIVEQSESVYTTWLGANPDVDTCQLRFGYSSMVTPASVYSLDMATGQRTLLKQTEVLGDVDVSSYETTRLWATGTDGTRIPLSLVWKKDRPAAPGPAVLYGYGAYEASIDPVFSVARLSLLDRGFVFAIAHVRGGGEMGRRWYNDGKMENKANSFTDFLACAQHLVDEGWTTPAQLCARGGSAGGLLVGAALNLSPESFGAVVAEVPFVDVVSTMSNAALALTVGEWEEWGNPVASEADYLRMVGYSPYDNVEDNHFPAVYATAGLNDPRVNFWEPMKWVQRLREHSQSNRPILLQTEMDAGHGGPSGRYQAWHDEARTLSFIIEYTKCP